MQSINENSRECIYSHYVSVRQQITIQKRRELMDKREKKTGVDEIIINEIELSTMDVMEDAFAPVGPGAACGAICGGAACGLTCAGAACGY